MTLQEALANITGVTARLEALTAERDTNVTALSAAQARVAELEIVAARVETAEAAVATLTTRAEAAEGLVTTHAARITELEGAQADFEARVGIAAQNLLASQGHRALNLSKSEAKPGEGTPANTMTREAFAALTPAARTEFSKNGGKLTD